MNVARRSLRHIGFIVVTMIKDVISCINRRITTMAATTTTTVIVIIPFHHLTINDWLKHFCLLL
ncbi:hypothetical protein LguiA_036647 [Lonicera macranthoides]